VWDASEYRGAECFFLNVFHTMIQHAFTLVGPPSTNIKA
jgi:hypothetical protein